MKPILILSLALGIVNQSFSQNKYKITGLQLGFGVKAGINNQGTVDWVAIRKNATGSSFDDRLLSGYMTYEARVFQFMPLLQLNLILTKPENKDREWRMGITSYAVIHMQQLNKERVTVIQISTIC